MIHTQKPWEWKLSVLNSAHFAILPVTVHLRRARSRTSEASSHHLGEFEAEVEGITLRVFNAGAPSSNPVIANSETSRVPKARNLVLVLRFHIRHLDRKIISGEGPKVAQKINAILKFSDASCRFPLCAFRYTNARKDLTASLKSAKYGLHSAIHLSILIACTRFDSTIQTNESNWNSKWINAWRF